MDMATFKARLEELGADLARWPPAEAEAALDLLAASTVAQDLFAHATADDLALEGDEASRRQALIARTRATIERGD